MKIYYAHCQSIYGTPQEQRDLDLLGCLFLGFTRGVNIVNPASQEITERCAEIRRTMRAGDVSTYIMESVFKPIAQGCDVFAFRALPDGRIPAGVAKELAWALEAHKPVIELPSNVLSRIMPVDATRQYLFEVGNR